MTEQPKRHTAVTKASTSYEDLSATIIHCINGVYAFLRVSGVQKTGHNIAYYSGQQGEPFDIEVGVQVAGPFDSDGPVVSSILPRGRVATATHVGPYPEMHRTHKLIVDWCALNAIAVAGPRWEIYGDWSEDENELRTEVYHLLQ